METHRRRLAIIFSAIFLFIFLSANLVLATQSAHDCIGECCPVCYILQAAEETLENLSTAVTVTAVAAAVTFGVCAVILFVTKRVSLTTPVELKVKNIN